MLEVIFTYIPSYFVVLIAVWWFWHGWNTWTALKGKEQQGYREYVDKASNEKTPFVLLQEKAEKFENLVVKFIGEKDNKKNKWRDHFTFELFFTAFLLAFAYSSGLFILNWFWGGSNQFFGIEIIENPFNIPIICQKILLALSLVMIAITNFSKSMRYYLVGGFISIALAFAGVGVFSGISALVFCLVFGGVVYLALALDSISDEKLFRSFSSRLISFLLAFCNVSVLVPTIYYAYRDTLNHAVVMIIAIIIIIIFAIIIYLLDKLCENNKFFFNLFMSLCFFSVLVLILYAFTSGKVTSLDSQIYIVFIFLLSLVNAISDWVSYAATRSIFDQSRKELKKLEASDEKKWWKIIVKYIGWDIGVAFVMFFVMSGLLFGLFWVLGEITPDSPFSASGLWRLIVSENTLKEHFWIWVMVFSTLLPTAMHIVYGIMALFTGFIFHNESRKENLIGKLKEINSENEKGKSLILSLDARLYAFLHIELRRMFSKWVLIPIAILAVGLLWQIVVGISFIIHHWILN